MRVAKRRKFADAGGGEDDRGDDAEQRIASLDARGEDGDAENGPRNRRHVKDRYQQTDRRRRPCQGVR
jgi:hypothetical protein